MDIKKKLLKNYYNYIIDTDDVINRDDKQKELHFYFPSKEMGVFLKFLRDVLSYNNEKKQCTWLRVQHQGFYWKKMQQHYISVKVR